MKKGFTLTELLIVVLIIGVLSSIALPQYTKAVDKSRFSTLMPVANHVKDAQEAFYLSSWQYTTDLESAGVNVGTVSGNKAVIDDVSAEVTADGTDGYVTVSKEGLDNRYVMYFNRSANYPQEIHCEALTSSDRAKGLCKSLGGTELGTNGSYTKYVLDGTGNGTTNESTPEPTPTPDPVEPEPEPEPEPVVAGKFTLPGPIPEGHWWQGFFGNEGLETIVAFLESDFMGEDATALYGMNMEYYFLSSGGCDGVIFTSPDGKNSLKINFRSFTSSVFKQYSTGEFEVHGTINGTRYDTYNPSSSTRMGWTGEKFVIAPSKEFNYDMMD